MCARENRTIDLERLKKYLAFVPMTVLTKDNICMIVSV